MTARKSKPYDDLHGLLRLLQWSLARVLALEFLLHGFEPVPLSSPGTRPAATLGEILYEMIGRVKYVAHCCFSLCLCRRHRRRRIYLAPLFVYIRIAWAAECSGVRGSR